MRSSQGAKKAAQRRPTLKPASLISKRSSSGLLHSRRGRRGVSSRHRTNRNQVGAPAPRRRGPSPRRRGRAHLSGSGRPSPASSWRRPLRVVDGRCPSPPSNGLVRDHARSAAKAIKLHAYSTPKRPGTAPLGYAERSRRGNPKTRITKGFSNDPELTSETLICPAEAEVASSNLAGRIFDPRRAPRERDSRADRPIHPSGGRAPATGMPASRELTTSSAASALGA